MSGVVMKSVSIYNNGILCFVTDDDRISVSMIAVCFGV